MDDIDKILIFDIFGPFAHFRKYYTNASALTYGIPPRTVVMGMIASILGLARDSYYEELGEQNTRIGIQIISKFRKIMQTVNYINTKLPIKLGGNPQQVNLEIIVPIDDVIKYRIFFYNEKYIDKLSEKIKYKNLHFGLYFGLSEFLADIELISLTKKVKRTKNQKIKINSVFKQSYINELDFTDKEVQYMIERMPINFKKKVGGKYGRELYLFDNYIYEINGNEIKADFKVGTEIYEIEYNGGKNNIIFME